MSKKLLGQPLPRDVCQKFVDKANAWGENWVEIRVDCDDWRVFVFDTKPYLAGDWWVNDGYKTSLGTQYPPVNHTVWGIRRTDWKAMLAEIAGQ
jgi:hypothetical protein